MAADAYLKVAAGQLHQAASAVKKTAEQIRSDASKLREQMESDILGMQTTLKVKEVELDRRNDDPNAAAIITSQIQKLQSDIDAKKKELDQHIANAEQAARSKEGAVQGLQSQAQALERQAGDPALQ